MRKLTRTEVDEILLAATILGTGGGGSLDEGMKLMDEIFSQGKDLILADYDEVPEDALIGSPYMCGAISPLTEEEKEELEKQLAFLTDKTLSLQQTILGLANSVSQFTK